MEIDLERLGFRKGFDWNNRFDLKTKVGDYVVSTVDLGINHQFLEGLPPLYYETMIFRKDRTYEKNLFNYYQERYTTEEEAKKGHEEAVEFVKKELERYKKIELEREKE